MRGIAVALAVVALASAQAGCCAWQRGAPVAHRAYTGDADALHPGAPVRLHAEVTIESEDFAGEFTGVLVAVPGGRARVRLQLFPDVGPKVLDVAVGAERVQGRLARPGGDDLVLDVARDAVPDRPGLPALAGATLAAAWAPVSPGRIERTRTCRGTIERFDLRPTALGAETHAVLAADGTVDHLRLRLGRISWEVRPGLRPGETLEVRAPGFRLRARITRRTLLDEPPPDDLFTLEGGR